MQYNADTISGYVATCSGLSLVFTNGCFDILHPGHIQYLAAAKALGDRLIVGINSDDSVRKLKGPHRPIHHQAFRMTMVAALRSVDAVVLFDEATPTRLLRIIKPHIHVKGGDYTPTDLPEYDTVVAYGGQVRCLAFVPGYSTTAIIQQIQQIPATE
jgi:rfaE bifunctional protein nucleotidyltransferase chain/domain